MNGEQRVRSYEVKRKRHSIWRNVVTCFAAVVVFCTTYALILPAITMEGQTTYCGLEEHLHTEECFELICEKEERYVHYHNDDCYDKDHKLTCELKEPDFHVHSSACYQKQTCKLEVSDGHTHDDSCYTSQSVLFCDLEENEEHTHGDDCYTVETALSCGKEESPKHAHGDGCFERFTEPACGEYAPPLHTHNEDCYENLCGIAFHSHTDDCYVEPTEEEQLAALSDDLGEDNGAGDQMLFSAMVLNDPAPQSDGGPLTREEWFATVPDELLASLPEDYLEELMLDYPEGLPEEAIEGLRQMLAGQYGVSPANDWDGKPEDLVAVSKQTTTTGTGKLKYDPATDRFELGVKVDFEFTTGWQQTYYGGYYAIIDPDNPQYTMWGPYYPDMGTHFQMNLGPMEIKNEWGDAFERSDLEEAGLKKGEYQFSVVDGNLILDVWIDRQYINSGAIKGSIAMDAYISGDYADNEGNLSYPVDGGINLNVKKDKDTYPPGTSAAGDISVSKNFGSYNKDSNTYSYTVSVTTNRGTPGDINFKDVIETKGFPINGLTSVMVSKNYQTAEPKNPTPQLQNEGPDGNNKKIEMSLPKLEAGQRYDITYTYSLNELEPGAHFEPKNRVEVTSKGDTPGTEVRANDEKTTNINVPTPPPSSEPTESSEPTDTSEPSNPSSDPSQSSDPSDNPQNVQPELYKYHGYDWNDQIWSNNKTVVPWGLIVNSNKKDLTGVTLTDTMLDQRLESPALFVKVDNTQVSDYSDYLTISGNDILFKDDANGKQIEIIYYTSADSLHTWAGSSVTNEATMLDRKVSQTVYGGNEGGLSKTNGSISVDETDSTKINISWTVTVTVGSDGMPAEYALTDSTMPNGLQDSSATIHYYKPGTVKLYYGNNNEVKTPYTVTYYDQKDGNDITSNPVNATYMSITFQSDPFASDAQGVNGSNQLVLVYDTVADLPAGGSNATYKNQAWYRDRNAQTDAKTSKPYVEKYDGKFNLSDTEVENEDGTLNWIVKTRVGAPSNVSSLTMVDKLPEHVLVTSLRAESRVVTNNDYKRAELTISSDGTLSGQNDTYSFSGTLALNEEGRYVAEVTAQNKINNELIDGNTEFFLYVFARIDPDYLATIQQGSFTNDSWVNTNNGEMGSDSQTQDWHRPPTNPAENAMDKTGVWNQRNQRLDYTVEINPEGKDLQPNNSMVYVTDEFSYAPDYNNQQLNLIYGLIENSVKLYKATLNGTELVKGDEITTGWRWVADEIPYDPGYGIYTTTKILKLEVPDSTPLILEYSYRLDGRNPDIKSFKLQASNKAYFNLYPDDAAHDSKQDQDWAGSSTSGTIYTGESLTVTKVEEGNNRKPIGGAKFHIYQAVPDGTNGWKWEQVTLTSDSGTITEYETGVNGKIEVEFEQGYSTNVLYKLVEFETADGYYFPEENPPEIKFYFRDVDDTENVLPHAYMLEGAKNLTDNSAFAYVSNSLNSANFTVEKVWKDKVTNEILNGTRTNPSIQFELVQVAKEEKQDNSVIDPLINNATVELKIGGWNEQATTRTFTVARGTTITVTIHKDNEDSGNKPVARTYVPGTAGHYYNLYKTVPLASETAKDFTFVYTVNHNVVLDVRVNANPNTYSSTYSISSQPNQNTGVTLPELEIEDQVIATYTLNSTNNWHWNSDDYDFNPNVDGLQHLPIRGTVTDDKGNLRSVWYTYYVREKSGNYETHYSNESGDVIYGITKGNITITNYVEPTPEPTTLTVTVEKQWQGTEPENNEATFKLYRKEWGTEVPSSEQLQDSPYGVVSGMADADLPSGVTCLNTADFPVYTTTDKQWVSGELPAKSDDDNYYSYFVVEQIPAGRPYSLISVSGDVFSISGQITLTNQVEETSVKVQKTWEFYEANTQISELLAQSMKPVTFEVMRGVKDDDSGKLESVGTIEVSKDSETPWYGEMDHLPKYGTLGEGDNLTEVEYVYTVKENDSEQPLNSRLKEDIVLNEATGIFEATNVVDAKTSVSVQKRWTDQFGNPINPDMIKPITVYLIQSEGEIIIPNSEHQGGGEGEHTHKPGTVQSNQNGTHSILCAECDGKYATNVQCDTNGPDGACSVCGYKAAPAHQHTPSPSSNSNGTHTISCSACGETLQSNVQCDTQGADGACSVCGYKAPAVHTHERGSYERLSNGQHRQACTANDGYYFDSESCSFTYSHVDGNENQSYHKGVCDKCGNETVPEMCTFVNNECTTCHFVQHVHNFTQYTSNNNGTHVVKCASCDATQTEDCDTNNNGACSKCGYKPDSGSGDNPGGSSIPAHITFTQNNVPIAGYENGIDTTFEVGQELTISCSGNCNFYIGWSSENERGGQGVQDNEYSFKVPEGSSLNIYVQLSQWGDHTLISNFGVSSGGARSMTRRAFAAPAAAAPAGTIQTITLGANNLTWSGEVPLYGTNSNGDIIRYSYDFQELEADEYDAQYTFEDGVRVITNTVDVGFELPQTGGTGTQMYTMAGLALSLGAVLGLMKQTKRKKGES